MRDRFLLYIDILGFAEMTAREPRKVARVYSIIDSLNVHRHQSFKTIVFSDTVLVYNPTLAATDEDRKYLVWYLTEFAEDLHHRLTGQDIYFRAVLTSGQFSHYELQNVECFFGKALISAYRREKEIPAMGLFIDDTCMQYNRYFRTADFGNGLHFVYLNRHLEYLHEATGDKYPLKDSSLVDGACFVPWQVRYLKDVHKQMRSNESSAVRAKHLATWDFHARRYPEMMRVLVDSDFKLSALASPHTWRTEARTMEKDIRYFKRIGSGTSLSREIVGS